MGEEAKKRPFVLVFGLMRTGTTLVQELLTHPPESFVFHEPWFHRNTFLLTDLSCRMLQEGYGVDVSEAVVEYRRKYQRYSWLKYTGDVVNAIVGKIQQVGVKEIRLTGWFNYISTSTFPFVKDHGFKILLMYRDPRDIYISCYNRLKLKVGSNAWKPRLGKLTPVNLYNELLPDVAACKSILNSCKEHVLVVPYDELCLRFDEWWVRIREFVDFPTEEHGEIGAFHKLIERGHYELGRHSCSVTKRSCSRFAGCTDFYLRQEAKHFGELMHEYTSCFKRPHSA